MRWSREQLRADLASEGAAKFLFFWGHTPKVTRAGEVDASCLSQWFPSPFSEAGVAYKTAEHFMMAGKARLFGDQETLASVLAARTPAEAKALGRQVRNFDEAAWARACVDIVVRGNVAKFGQNEHLGRFLRSTGDRVLVEASPRDRVWGIGLGASNPDARDPSKWRGLNLLGFALMEARSILFSSDA